MPLRCFRLAVPLAIPVVLAVSAAPARAADIVVAGTQIVQGNQCVGTLCVDGEPFGTLDLMVKTSDTPAIRMAQTADGGFTAQTWDIGANEANFFVRDLTGGSRLPFRIRPGAPTSSLDIAATGDMSTAGMLSQDVGSISVGSLIDREATLTALRGLTLSRYTLSGDPAAPHVGPTGAAFRAAFAVGKADNRLAAADSAGIALVAIQALDAKVSALASTPGATGADGPAGATGAAGAAGLPGTPAGPTATDPQLAALVKANRTLTKSNQRLTKGLASLKAQVKALAARR